MKSALQIAPNSKKLEESSSKKRTELTKRTISQKDVKRINIKTPDDVTPKQRPPTVNNREKEVKPQTPGKSGSVERKKKDIPKKTINLIIKKSFTYVESGTSIGIFDGKGNSKIKEGLPPRSPNKFDGRRIPANVVKATKPVTPVRSIAMPGISASRQSVVCEKKGAKKVESVSKSPKDSASSGSTKSTGKRVKKKKEWDDNFASTKKESQDEKKKKVNFELDVYRELMTQALNSPKKVAVDQGKSKLNEEKRFKAKQGQPKAKKSPTRAKSVESKPNLDIEENEPEEKPKEPEEEAEKLKKEIKELKELVKKREEVMKKPEEVVERPEEVVNKPEEVVEKPEEVRNEPEMPKMPQEVIKELEEVFKKPDNESEQLEQEPENQEEPPESIEDQKPPVEEPPVIEEINQQIEEADRGSLIDKLRHELQMNILNKLYICSGSKRSNSIEKVAEAADKPSKLADLMSNTNQTKHRWNLKSYPLKRKRIKGTVDDRCNASLTDGKLFDDAIIKLKRHNTEPHSYRGFIWRHSSDMPNNCNDYSVTSLASSLKHLNTDDLEDFVFWETVPPKSTSCWEVSLYQSKKPWSVLSCSVFQSNRLSDTPGVILENLRSGRTYDSSRISYNAPVKPLPKSISFDVEPSIAQKNIDIRNWVAALNFEAPEPPPILTERTMSDQPPHQITPPNLSGKSVQSVPSDCLIKEKKLKKHFNDGKKTPGKRARSAFDEHSKMQLSIPPAENMSLINGVFLAKGVKVLDYDKKNDIIKTLITKGHPVKEQTNVVYMMHMKSPLKSASERVRKSRDGRKSQGEPSQAKSRENTSARSNTPSRKRDADDGLDGLVRKCSGGFVTVEQYKDGNKRPGEKVNFSGVEKIVNLTDFADEGNPHDSDDARPYSGGKKHKHEMEAPTGVCCLGEYRQLKPEESRKARMDYGRFALNKEIEAKKRARAKSRTRSRHRQPSSLLRLVTRRYSSDSTVRYSSVSFIKIFFIFLVLLAGIVTAFLKLGWLSPIYLMNFKEILAAILANFLNYLKD